MKKSGNTILSYLYEEPSRASRRINAIATAVFALLFALVLFFIVRRFYVTGQLEARYWSFFARRALGHGKIGGFVGRDCVCARVFDNADASFALKIASRACGVFHRVHARGAYAAFYLFLFSCPAVAWRKDERIAQDCVARCAFGVRRGGGGASLGRERRAARTA